MRMRSCKYRLYPSKARERELQEQFHHAKNLWNEGLSTARQLYADFGRFPTWQAYRIISKNSGLHSQVAQDIMGRLERGIRMMLMRKKRGLKAGFPRFRGINRVNSITYPQSGFSFNKDKLTVSRIGSMKIRRHRKLEGKVKTLTLKREAGKYYAIVATEQEEPPPKKNSGGQVGIDFGLATFATFSSGARLRKPEHYGEQEERLRAAQRRLCRKSKGSRNYRKAKLRLSAIHGRIRNMRRDWLHKAANTLLRDYSMIALESLDMRAMAQGHGKGVSDAGWAVFTDILCYKAEEAGCEVRFVDPRGTTAECSGCGRVVKKTLRERRHECPCGLSLGRDHNAAINILDRATGGAPGSNACGEFGLPMPVMQESPLSGGEAHGFGRG